MKEYINQIIHADCLDIMRELPDNSVDLVLTDPPYGIGADINQAKLANKKGFTKNAGTYKEYPVTNWDGKPPTIEYFEEMFRISKNQIIFGGNYFIDLKLSGVIVWNKGGSGNFKEGELAKTNIDTFKIFTYARSDAYINDIDVKIHPTQKPIRLFTWCLANYSKEKDLILDCFSGSGTTAIACHRLERRFICIEKEEKYVELSRKRLKEEQAQMRLEL